MVTLALAGITSCQLSADGFATGVRISRKFLARSLVRMKKWPPWCEASYSMFWRRGSRTRNSPRGIIGVQITLLGSQRTGKFDKNKSGGCAFFEVQA